MRSGFRLKRSRLRMDRQTIASRSMVSSSGRQARAAALKAPELQPTTPSGRIPASSKARSTPTVHAPRLPPPPSTKISLGGLGGAGSRRRLQFSIHSGNGIEAPTVASAKYGAGKLLPPALHPQDSFPVLRGSEFF